MVCRAAARGPPSLNSNCQVFTPWSVATLPAKVIFVKLRFAKCGDLLYIFIFSVTMKDGCMLGAKLYCARDVIDGQKLASLATRAFPLQQMPASCAFKQVSQQQSVAALRPHNTPSLFEEEEKLLMQLLYMIMMHDMMQYMIYDMI